MFGSDGRVNVWRKSNEQLKPKDSRSTIKHGGESLMSAAGVEQHLTFNGAHEQKKPSKSRLWPPTAFKTRLVNPIANSQGRRRLCITVRKIGYVFETSLRGAQPRSTNQCPTKEKKLNIETRTRKERQRGDAFNEHLPKYRRKNPVLETWKKASLTSKTIFDQKISI
ncbi:hypothetical protein Trydic_g22350 [Trypoxylus dichotomus]